MTGRPYNMSFSPAGQVGSPHHHQLQWTTHSHYTVDMFTLLYRKASIQS